MSYQRVFILLSIALLIMGFGYWQWGVKRWSGTQTDRQSISNAVELTVGEFRHPDSKKVTITAVKSIPQNIKFVIDFDHLEDPSTQQGFFTTYHLSDLAAMINGGYFDSSFQPVGLVMRDGQTISEMSKQPALSGVFAIFKDGTVQLIPRAAYRPNDLIDSAIQAGPFVVDPGGKPGIQSDDFKKAKRTAIGQTISGEIVFITTTPCTLYELSEILTKHQSVLGIDRFESVLNLDGGPSTGLYLQGFEKYHVFQKPTCPTGF